MSGRTLIFIVLSNLLSVAYAVEKSMAHSASSAIPMRSTANFLQTNSVPYGASTPADQYQYCFNISTWIVPPQTLLAYLYDNANVVPVSDQTVWIISNYN